MRCFAGWRFLAIIALGAVLAFLPCHAAPPDTAATTTPKRFSPQFSYAGHWVADGDPTPSTVTQKGKHVVSIYNNNAFAHKFEGDYIDPVTIKGIQIRRNLADDSVTRMELTLTFTSPNDIHETWIALDSNSDLQQGQTGTSDLKRAPKSAPATTPDVPAHNYLDDFD